MAFSVILQTNNSEKIKVDKTLVDIDTVSGTLKESTSIVDPIFLISRPIDELVNCNYITVSIFGRSYFVTDISSVRNNLTEIACHVDVLSSFKNAVRSNQSIVRRQENKWNLYLDDGVFKTYQNPMVLTKNFPTGFNTFEFVLAVAGSEQTATAETVTE